jgi:hypothetical protein
VTVKQVALRCRVGVGTVATWIREGELAATVDAKGRTVVTKAALDAFGESRKYNPDDDSRLRKALGPAAEDLLRPDEIGFIYFLLDGGTVVYVGSSHGSFSTRIARHRVNGMKFTASRVLVVEKHGRELQWEEHRYISMFKPKYNKSDWVSSSSDDSEARAWIAQQKAQHEVGAITTAPTSCP